MDSTYTCSDFPCALTMSELKQGFFWRGGGGTLSNLHLSYSQVMDIINDEESQFLKSLSQGKRLFERAVQEMESTVMPGDW